MRSLRPMQSEVRSEERQPTMTLETVQHGWLPLRTTGLVAAALGMLLMTVSSYTQTAKKETTMSQLAALQLDAVPQADIAEIRPFHFTVTDEQLADLRRRVAATKWPERETVSDATQGVQL